MPFTVTRVAASCRRRPVPFPFVAFRLAILIPAACCVALLAVAGGCAPRNDISGEPVADTRNLPQDPAAYLDPETADTPLASPSQSVAALEGFTARFYSPWDQEASGHAADTVFWALGVYGRGRLFGENMLPRSPEWVEKMAARMDRESFPNMARRGVTLRDGSLRLFPTTRPAFRDFSRAGEGYPFDYLQNSVILAGVPVFVSHESRYGAWLFVEAGFASGWMEREDVAFAGPEFREQYRTARRAALVKDETTIRDMDGRFVCKSGIGAVFPLLSRRGQETGPGIGQEVGQRAGPGFVILAPRADMDGNAVAVRAMAPADAAMEQPASPTPRAIARVAGELMGQAYGWGGMYGNRDCSAMLKDLFTPFGIWLPRNSTYQAKYGGTLTWLANFRPEGRERHIIKNAQPFFTLVWLRGHIMLYLGEREGRAVVMHNLWGLRTIVPAGQGRKVVGRAVITTLRPGRELPFLAPGGELINRVRAITRLGQ